MHKWRFGFGMRSLNRNPSAPAELPVTAAELARIGIPARKIPRVLRELDRAARADPRLTCRAPLLRLARSFAALLP